MLLSAKHKKLILNLRDPDRITNVIPGAKKLQYRGRTLVAVPHRLDEVRVLRNLGLDAPAPVSTYYDWPGLYKPFTHQRTTVEFLTTNPRAFCLNGMGCIEGDASVRVSRKGKSQELTLRELHHKFHSLPDKSAWKVRSLKGAQFGMNELLDVLDKGIKPTLRITLADGKSFRATADHQIARPDGSWTEAGALRVGDELVTNGRVELICGQCGCPREVAAASAYRSRGQMCALCRSKAHGKRMRGAGNSAFKGRPFIDSDGYVRVWMPDHHRADNSGRVYEHILVAEAQLGHAITRDFHVHHINGVKHDNRPENLSVMLGSEHHRSHAPFRRLDGSVSAKGGRVVATPKSSPILSIEDGGLVDVYDLCMRAPHHNFVVNGVVVHNSGKTLSVLWAFDYLRSVGLTRRLLVVAPLSTLERAWGDEIFRHFPHLSFTVLHGDREKRHRLLAEDHDVYIINHDGIKNEQTLRLLAAREGLDLLVIDELAEFRNASTDRWKCINALVNGDQRKGLPAREWVWGLTGTPMPNYPTDVWAQVRLIQPTRVPKQFTAFRSLVMTQVTSFRWVARDSALETVRGVMQPAVRFSREECIDLPPTTYITRHAPMTAEQTRAHEEMMKKLRMEYAGGQITAANAGVKLSKILQIASGVVYSPDGTEVVLPCGPRLEVLRELVAQSGSKVLVFVPFTAALQSVAEALRRDYSVAVVFGGTPKQERDRIFHEFQKNKDPHIIVADARTMSHGLTLTAASMTIWFGPASSNVYTQANERTPRPGQKLATLIAHIESSPVERAAYQRLEQRQSTQDLLLDMLKGG